MVPLVSKGKVLATFSLLSSRPQAYAERERKILERVAPFMASAIENPLLFQELDQLALALESIGDAVVFLDTQGKIQFINRAAQETYGYGLSRLRVSRSPCLARPRPRARGSVSPNPPKDTDGRREESGRGGEGATGEIAWVPFGVGRSADGLHRRTGAPMAVCGSCDARDGERIRSRGLSRPGWHESAGIFGCPVGGSVADGAVRPGVEWLAAGPRRG